jgi:hypothetical protein
MKMTPGFFFFIFSSHFDALILNSEILILPNTKQSTSSYPSCALLPFVYFGFCSVVINNSLFLLQGELHHRLGHV